MYTVITITHEYKIQCNTGFLILSTLYEVFIQQEARAPRQAVDSFGMKVSIVHAILLVVGKQNTLIQQRVNGVLNYGYVSESVGLLMEI